MRYDFKICSCRLVSLIFLLDFFFRNSSKILEGKKMVLCLININCLKTDSGNGIVYINNKGPYTLHRKLKDHY